MVAAITNESVAPAINWEQDLAALLEELSSVQDELLSVLVAKKNSWPQRRSRDFPICKSVSSRSGSGCKHASSGTGNC